MQPKTDKCMRYSKIGITKSKGGRGKERRGVRERTIQTEREGKCE